MRLLSTMSNQLPDIVELLFLMYKTAYAILEPTVKLYLYQSVCVEHFADNDNLSVFCTNTSANSWVERDTQERAAQYLMWYKILLNAPTMIVSLYAGTWSDRTGRRMPIFLSCFSMVLTATVYLLSRYIGPPYTTFVLVGAAINGCFGKSAVITMAVYSYAADYTDKTGRTNKIARLTAMNFLGQFIGTLCAGFTLDNISFRGVFISVISVNCLTLIVGILFLKEPNHITDKPNKAEESILEEDMDKNPSHYGEDKPKDKPSVFIVSYLKESFAVLLRQREHNGRFHFITMIIVIFVHQMCKQGETDIKMLYVRKSPFGWTKSMYGYLLAATNAAIGIGSFFLLPYLSKNLEMKDVHINMIAILFKMARVSWIAFSTASWMIYCGAAFEISGGMLNGGLKSLISKLVTEEEFGKCFSLISSSESLANLIGPIFYNLIYAKTMPYFAGFAFLVEGIIYLSMLVALCAISKDLMEAANYRMIDRLHDKPRLTSLDSEYGYDLDSDEYNGKCTSNYQKTSWKNGQVANGEIQQHLDTTDANSYHY